MNPQENKNWKEVCEKLPYGPSAEEKERRDKIWNQIDVNGNGYLSLAEVDKGMRDVIRLPVLFNLKPVMMRAFTKAKNTLKSKNAHGDDYVSKAQFKFLLAYLMQIYEYWMAFQKADINHDRRITVHQFVLCVPLMQKWGLTVVDPQATFAQIDTNKGGFILFDEFCTWAQHKHLTLQKEK